MYSAPRGAQRSSPATRRRRKTLFFPLQVSLGVSIYCDRKLALFHKVPVNAGGEPYCSTQLIDSVMLPASSPIRGPLEMDCPQSNSNLIRVSNTKILGDQRSGLIQRGKIGCDSAHFILADIFGDLLHLHG